MIPILRASFDEARDCPGFAEEAARPDDEYCRQQHADGDDLESGGTRLVLGWNERADKGAGKAPESPHHESTGKRAAIVARAADDEHGPDLESERRKIVVGRDEADEMRLDGNGKRHDGAAEDEGLEPVEIGILAERCGRGLVLADRPPDASPRAAPQPLAPDETHPGA